MGIRIIPQHVEGPEWPVNPLHGEDSWPQYQTFTPNQFIPRYGWDIGALISPQALRTLYDYLVDQELGAYRWEEEMFYAKGYWREATSWVPPDTGLLAALVELLRRAFTAADRANNTIEFFNIYGNKVDQVDIPVGGAGPPGPPGEPGSVGPAGPAGRRGTLWFVGQGPPVQTTGVLERDMYLDTLSGAVWAFEGTRWVRK